MTTMMSDLSDDLVEEILSRVPLTSLGAVRSACKLWNNLSKDRLLCKAQARQQFLGFTMKDSMLCSFRFDLHGIQNEDVEFVEPSIKQIDKFKQAKISHFIKKKKKKKIKISQVCHCDGLLLLVTYEENPRLVVWNPYLAQTRLIRPRNCYYLVNAYAFGYDDKRNPKILMVAEDYEIYDFMSNSWRVLDVIQDYSYVMGFQDNVSLKGNSYFIVRREEAEPTEIENCLLCFDFSRDRFGRCLSLPFHIDEYIDTVVLSSTGEEQLAVLYKPCYTSEIKIWVTTKIEPNSVSWSNFLTVDITPLYFYIFRGSFFIEQEKKLAVLFDLSRCNVACIIGENGCLRETPPNSVYYPPHLRHYDTRMCFYAPSLVQISQGLDRDF